MSEQIKQPEYPLDSAIDKLAIHIPEIADNHDMILEGSRELSSTFELKEEFFDKPERVLFLAALGQRTSQLEVDKPHLTVSQYTDHKEFIVDAMAMLSHKFSNQYESFKYQLDTEADTEALQAEQERTYDRFTNKQVTAELAAAMDDGLLAGVKNRLGITPETEDRYTLHVLNIGDDDTLGGMRPSYDLPYDSETWAEHEATLAAYDTYEADLKAGSDKLRSELGTDVRFPVAWVSTINGRKHLNIPLPTAEKILYPDQQRAAYYTEENRAQDIAILEHEYTHTQGGLSVDGQLYYGLAFEERRAEFFSQDKQGYSDIKHGLNHIALVSGFDIRTFMKGRPKGGTPAELFSEMSRQLGLQETLEIALKPPSAYVNDVRPIQKAASEYLGGPDELLEHLHERCHGYKNNEGKTYEDGIDKLATMMAGFDNDGEFVRSYVRNVTGGDFIIDQVEARMAELAGKN